MMNETTKQAADKFSCKYLVFEKGTDPQLAEQAYRSAYQKAKAGGGFWPALVCLDESLLEWLGIIEEEYDRDTIIAECRDNGKEILQERFQEYMECYEDGGYEEFIGAETQGEMIVNFSGYESFDDHMLEADTLLLEVPVDNPWELIGYVPLGGWNDCPSPKDMIAVCKYWYQKYQAVPAVFTHDVMEFYAPAKLNGADSMEAAKEHYAFCTDRVDQGTRTYTLSELAAGLAESEVWYFWWD